jgi:hypothetical protein
MLVVKQDCLCHSDRNHHSKPNRYRNPIHHYQLIHTARRMYQRPASGITTGDKQDLARRFSMAHSLLVEKERLRTGVARLPEELLVLQKRLEEYQNELSRWGLKDYQVSHLEQLSFNKMLYTFTHGVNPNPNSNLNPIRSAI